MQRSICIRFRYFTLKDRTYFEGICDQRSAQNPNEEWTEANGANALYDGV